MIKFEIKELDKYYDPFYTYSIFKDSTYSIFLDSSKEDRLLSKYSFIGLNRYKKFISKGRKVLIDNEEYDDVDPFDKLENLIDKYKLNIKSNIPFVSGAIDIFHMT